MSDPTNDPGTEPTTDEAATMDDTESTPGSEAPLGDGTTEDASPQDTATTSTPSRTRHRTSGPGGRHPVNIGHLVMGLAFAGLVVIWALIEGDVIADRDIRWLLPIPWVLAGTAGLLAVTLGNRSRRNP